MVEASVEAEGALSKAKSIHTLMYTNKSFGKMRAFGGRLNITPSLNRRGNGRVKAG